LNAPRRLVQLSAHFMRRLSSRGTVVPQYIIPAFIAALLIFSAVSAPVWWESLCYIMIFGGAGAYAIAFAVDLCHASTDGQVLFLRGLRRTDAVPLREIKEVVAFTKAKWPHIDIVFRRPTAFGTDIRIIPRDDFWATYELLAAHAESKLHDNDEDVKRRAVKGARAPLIITVTIVLVAIVVGIVMAMR
jgi:hypothetical protein